MKFRLFSSPWLLIAAGTLAMVVTGSASTIDVQATTFKLSGNDLPLSLLHQSMSGDEALFTRLVGMVAEGSAELVADCHTTVISGKRAGVQALREQPYPDELERTNRPDELLAKSFEYKNCGSEFTAELILRPSRAGDPRSGETFGNLSIDSVLGDLLSNWPLSLPHRPADGRFDYLQFTKILSLCPFRSSDSSHHLLSLVNDAGNPAGKRQSYSLTFGKAASRLRNPAHPTGDPARLLRLQVLTFQTSLTVGRPLIRSRGSDGDQALLAALLRSMAEGAAELTCHTMTHVDPDFVPIPPTVAAGPSAGTTPAATAFDGAPPNKVNPSASALGPARQPSIIQSFREFSYPTEYNDELLPISFEILDIGNSLEANVLEPVDHAGTRLAIQLEHGREPAITAWPESTGSRTSKIYQIYQPSFSTTSISTTLTVNPGGVYCLGAITLPEQNKTIGIVEPRMEITLLKVQGDPAPGSGGPGPTRAEWQCERISLTAEDASALAALHDKPAAAEAFLETTLQGGTARCLTFCLLPNAEAAKSGIRVIVELPYPEGARWTKERHLLPTDMHFLNCGPSLEREDTASGMRMLNFRHVIAPYPFRITTEALIDVANRNRDLPQEPLLYAWNRTFPLTALSGVQITPPEKIHVPAGHPEEGRWQVSVSRRQMR